MQYNKQIYTMWAIKLAIDDIKNLRFKKGE